MKVKLLLTVFITLISVTLFGQKNEEQAILKTARNEADAFYRRNLKEWRSYRIQDADASFTFVTKDSYIYIKGWDSINTFITRIINNSKPTLYEFKLLNPIIKINGNLAWLEFDQVSTTPATDTIDENFQSHEEKILLKENGKWKILSQIGTDSESWKPKPSDVENTLNSTSYQLLADKQVNDAIEIFKLNIKLHPNSWNAYDSMGEAYAIAGNKQLAIENYETSIKINPTNESGKASLAKLKN